MCDRCRNTPVDPNDTEFIEGEIQAVTFEAEDLPPDTIALLVESDHFLGAVLSLPVFPGPTPGEHVRIYGVTDASRADDQTIRGVVVGIGEGESPRVAFYRTRAHERELTEKAATVLEALATLDELIRDAEADPYADPMELAEMRQTRARAVELYGIDPLHGAVTRVPAS